MNKDIKDLDDGTYDFNLSAINFTYGYQVSFINDMNKNDVDEIKKCLRLLNKPPYIGVYKGEPEISFFVDDLREAISWGILFEQYSIWDWAKGREIVIKR